MSSNLLRKTVCLLVLTAMLLSALLVVPQGFAQDGTETYDISGVVVTPNDFKGVPGATVKLYNLHSGQIETNVTLKSGNTIGQFLFEDISPGFYKLMVNSPSNLFVQTNGSISEIIVLEDQNVQEILYLNKVPTKPLFSVEGVIYDEYNDGLAGAEVTLKVSITQDMLLNHFSPMIQLVLKECIKSDHSPATSSFGFMLKVMHHTWRRSH